MLKFKVGMEVELEFSEDMNTELTITELLQSGDVKVGELKCYMLDPDGNNIMNDDIRDEAAQAIMAGLMGAGAK